MAHQSFTPQPILSFLPPRLHSSTQKKYKYISGTQKEKNRLHFEEEKTLTNMRTNMAQRKTTKLEVFHGN